MADTGSEVVENIEVITLAFSAFYVGLGMIVSFYVLAATDTSKRFLNGCQYRGLLVVLIVLRVLGWMLLGVLALAYVLWLSYFNNTAVFMSETQRRDAIVWMFRPSYDGEFGSGTNFYEVDGTVRLVLISMVAAGTMFAFGIFAYWSRERETAQDNNDQKLVQIRFKTAKGPRSYNLYQNQAVTTIGISNTIRSYACIVFVGLMWMLYGAIAFLFVLWLTYLDYGGMLMSDSERKTALNWIYGSLALVPLLPIFIAAGCCFVSNGGMATFKCLGDCCAIEVTSASKGESMTGSGDDEGPLVSVELGKARTGPLSGYDDDEGSNAESEDTFEGSAKASSGTGSSEKTSSIKTIRSRSAPSDSTLEVPMRSLPFLKIPAQVLSLSPRRL
jgi:hypothetical protein